VATECKILLSVPDHYPKSPSPSRDIVLMLGGDGFCRV
jgi:hypothetical protein